MNRINFLAGMIVCASMSGCATLGGTSDLDRQIAEKRAQMTQVTGELHSAAGPQLSMTNDVYAAVRYRPISQFLSDVTVPEYVVTGVGTEAHGDVLYQGGVGKAWIEPAHDSKAWIHLHNVSLAGSTTGASFTGGLNAQFETRLKFNVLHVGGNVLCKGHFDDTPVSGGLTLGAVANDAIPYTLAITSPPSLSIQVACGIGHLGTYHQSFEVKDIARDLSKGTIPLGFTSTGKFALPPEAGGQKFTYSIAAKQPQLASSATMIEYKTDATITVTPDQHP